MLRWNNILDHTISKIYEFGGQIRGYHFLDDYSIQFFIRGGNVCFLSIVIEIDMNENEITNILMKEMYHENVMSAA